MYTARRRVRPFLFVVLFSGLFSAFSPVFAEEEASKHKDGHHAQSSLDWPGIYQGFLPCSDCVGTKMTLALNKRGTYVLITQYVGKSPREYVEKGKFTWSDKDNTILLTPRNKGESHQYLVAENMLIRLDENGNRITGDMAERYILRRNDVTDSGPSSSHAH